MSDLLTELVVGALRVAWRAFGGSTDDHASAVARERATRRIEGRKRIAAWAGHRDLASTNNATFRGTVDGRTTIVELLGPANTIELVVAIDLALAEPVVVTAETTGVIAEALEDLFTSPAIANSLHEVTVSADELRVTFDPATLHPDTVEAVLRILDGFVRAAPVERRDDTRPYRG